MLIDNSLRDLRRNWRFLLVVGLLLAIQRFLITNPGGTWRWLAYLAGYAGLWWYAAKRNNGWETLGLSKESWCSGLWLGLLSSAIITLLLLAAYGADGARFAEDLASADAGDLAFSVMLNIPLSVAIYEELVFRGLILGRLYQNSGVWFAVIVSALLFGLWHLISWNAAELLSTALAGLVLAWLRLSSGSVLAPIMAHLSANIVATCLAYLYLI